MATPAPMYRSHKADIDRAIRHLESAKKQLVRQRLEPSLAEVEKAIWRILQPLARSIHTEICEATRRLCPRCGNTPRTYGGTYNRHMLETGGACPMSYEDVIEDAPRRIA